MVHVDELEQQDVPEFDVPPDDEADAPLDDAPVDDFERVTDDGDLLPDEVQAELEALASAELDAGDGMEQALAEAQREIARQRTLTRQAVARFREALLAAEPDLPPDMVQGESLEEVEAAAEAARATVARIRERVAAERPRGFPVGAPARTSGRSRPLSAQEKIAAGLQERLI